MASRAPEGARTIRPAELRDRPAILALAAAVAEAGDAFPWEGDVTREELALCWLPDPQHRAETFVCETSSFPGIAGVYTLHPTAGGRCSHVANCLYMVAPAVRGRGLGKALCAHSVKQAKQQGYTGILLHTVVTTNSAAVGALKASGFRVVCTLPRVFRHPQHGMVDAHTMFHSLEDCIASPLIVSRPPTPCTASATCLQLPSPDVCPRALRTVNLVLSEPTSSPPSSTRSRPPRFDYPQATGGMNLATGEQVQLQPQVLGIAGGTEIAGAKFMVQPQLPPGLQLNKTSGAITGCPTTISEPTKYRVTATLDAEICLQVDEQAISTSEVLQINEDFATRLENVANVVDLMPEPSKNRSYGDWMIWMVHRAWLDDPALAELNFNNMHMPPAHIEERIAPKLMEAMKTNTNIKVLSLFNSNLQKPQALELAAALRRNTTLRTVNLECNWLDSISVRELALAISANPELHIENLRFSHQKQMGQFFGRPTEEAVGQMMERNESIVKLGFECDDAHWRNLIDRALLRNNDFQRRRQSRDLVEELPPADVKTLGNLLFKQPPQSCPSDVLAKRDLHLSLFRCYVLQNRKLPTTSQLQNCARNTGKPLPYNKAAPLIRDCRSEILRGCVGKQVVVTDAFGSQTEGTLRSWSEINNDQWTIDIWMEDGKRIAFRGSSEPAFSVSKAVAEWIRGSQNCAS